MYDIFGNRNFSLNSKFSLFFFRMWSKKWWYSVFIKKLKQLLLNQEKRRKTVFKNESLSYSLHAWLSQSTLFSHCWKVHHHQDRNQLPESWREVLSRPHQDTGRRLGPNHLWVHETTMTLLAVMIPQGNKYILAPRRTPFNQRSEVRRCQYT